MERQGERIIKLRAAKIDDMASLDIDKWILKLNQHKLEKILNDKRIKKETLYIFGSVEKIEKQEQRQDKDIEFYKFVFNDIKVASAAEIRLKNWVDYGITIRIARLREAASLSSWDWSLIRQLN